MNNGAVKTMVGALAKQYGDKALHKELSFCGGLPIPGFTQVTLQGTGLGLYFNTETGKPMGKLEGSLFKGRGGAERADPNYTDLPGSAAPAEMCSVKTKNCTT